MSSDDRNEAPQQMSPEDFDELMPDQSPPLGMRVLYLLMGVVTFGMLFSPAVAYFWLGIEGSVAFFLSALLIVIIQQ